MPEYLSSKDRSAEVAEHAVTWLSDEGEYGKITQQLGELKARIAHGGASHRAAEYIERFVERWRSCLAALGLSWQTAE